MGAHRVKIVSVTISERRREGLGQERLSVRLGPGYKDKLRELAERQGAPVNKWLESVIDEKWKERER